MKKIIYLAIVMLTMVSCDFIKETINPQAVASFSIIYGTRGNIMLNNASENFEKVLVDWGDGKQDTYYSTDLELTHRYSKDGNYGISMIAYGKKNSNQNTSKMMAFVNNTMGDFTVFAAAATGESRLNFYIDGVYVGYATKYMTNNGNVNCSTDVSTFGIKKELKPGTHTYKAITPSGANKWENNFVIENNTCTIRKLVF